MNVAANAAESGSTSLRRHDGQPHRQRGCAVRRPARPFRRHRSLELSRIRRRDGPLHHRVPFAWPSRRAKRFSILSGNRAESWAAICAAMVMGMRYTPLHPMAAEDDHAFIIDDAEVDVLIVDAGKFGPRGLAIKSRVARV